MITQIADHFASVEDLSVPAVEQALDKIVKNRADLSPTSLAEALQKRAHESGVSALIAELLPEAGELSIEALTDQLKVLKKEEGGLEAFAMRFAELVYLHGGAKPNNVLESTYELLQEIGKEVVAIRETPWENCAPKSTKTIKKLHELASRITDFRNQEPKIRNADYVALNDQYQQIQLAIIAEAEAFIDKVPQGVIDRLEKAGIIPLNEAKKWPGSTTADHIKTLVDAKILEIYSVPQPGKKSDLSVVCAPSLDVDVHSYEEHIPVSMRERIHREIQRELKTKYSSRYQSLGVSTTRPDGAVTLLDGVRLQSIAEKSGVSVTQVGLALRYLEYHRLLKVEDGAYTLTNVGNKLGLGLRAIRFMQDIEFRKSTSVSESDYSLDDYLSDVHEERNSWGVPTFTIESKNGEAPWVHLIDELHFGDARIDVDQLKRVIKDIQSKPDSLVVASNTTQGHPAHNPRKMRTSLPPSRTNGIDMRDHQNQIQLLNKLADRLDRKMVVLYGKHELETANMRVDVQRDRLVNALKALSTDEAEIKNHLSGMNEIHHSAQRKYRTKLHTELLKFMTDVVMPFELKLNREMMDSATVFEKAGLEMNEFEIVQDIASMIAQDRKEGGTAGREMVEATYGEFLALDEVGSDYLSDLESTLYPELQTLEPGKPVATGGVRIQFRTKDGKEGLTMLCKPDYKFGISESARGIDKILERIKGDSAMGVEIPDIITVGASGVPWLAMSAAGTTVIAGDSSISNDHDQRYIFEESQDYVKRRERSRGGPATAGSIAFSGGIHEHTNKKGEKELIKTGAYTLEMSNRKVLEVLEDNDKRNLKPGYVDVNCTSDLQLSSPTSKPATFLRSLLWAVAEGQEEIVLNGDLFQGDNYGRRKVESQLTGIIGLSDQQMMFGYMMELVLDAILEKAARDPEYKIPKFTFLLGNHETNTDRNYQGITLMEAAALQAKATYRTAWGSEFAEKMISFPRKFVDRNGTDVDYSHAVIDLTEETGFRMGVQHYVGSGAKGSKVTPPIAAMRHWALAMEAELKPLHFLNMGHFHTQSVTQDWGIIMAIFGANAEGSAYEHHLGYPTTVPASGRVRFHTDRPPELFFATDPYLRIQEAKMRGDLPVFNKVVEDYGSLENWVEEIRKMIVKRDDGNFTNYTDLKLARHNVDDAFGPLKID